MHSFDDKDMVIVGATSIAIIAMFILTSPDAKEVVISVVSGLFGVAVGQAKK